MRFELIFLESVDPSLGRVDRESLPQQAFMEMVIDGIMNKQKICGDANEPKDSEEWIGVTVEDEEVVSIRWRQFKLEGSLHLEWLPSSVMEFDATDNNLTGSLDWASLPTSLKKLNLAGNQFSANPTKGHLSVVGWTSTPVLGEAKNLFKPLVVFLSWRRPY
ncbi:hypothetical protein XU18_4128 [Perkinsela sp. CCAP 1560/4]|nr:hypothetical protein XU18_4128 [Perkinsela sp. CCAP 1560/4]|eukprot:KNH04690.1 hypothetical protein XU18_4128 [Perkinsela sp. CCAP 1560/4]